MKRSTALSLILLLLNGAIYAQGNPNPNPSLTNVVPPSPNAASLGKFGDIPVGYFTGIPQVNTPIYSYKNADNSLGLSISLDYHAGGVKVDDIGSNVGTGWALNAGGIIARTRRGIADENAAGGFINTPVLPDENEGNRYAVSKYMEISAGVWDSQTDIFNFNVGGKSGKFMFGKNNDFLMLTPNKVKIQWERSGNDIIRFSVTDESGTRYIFDALEYTVSGLTTFNYYVSSWYLTKVIAPFSTDSILIDYDSEHYTYAMGGNATQTIPVDPTFPSPPPSGSISGSEVLGKRIKKISFPDSTKVTFNYDNVARTDVGYLGNAVEMYRLKQIVISNGVDYRGYNLYHDYSINRLTLKSVIPYNASGEDKGYAYEYYGSLPERLSNSQDHWGFYNVNPGNTLIPHEYRASVLGSNYMELGGGNRETDVDRVKYGSLIKMTYPTGGYTDFEMEANQAYDTRLKKDIITDIQTHRPKSISGLHASNSTPEFQYLTFGGDPNTTTPFTISFSNGGYQNNTLHLELKNSANQTVDTRNILFSDDPNNDNQIVLTFNIYNLIPGNYTWHTSIQGPDYFEDYISAEWIEDWTSHPDTTILHIDNPYVGGLRVKSIKSYDGINSLPATAIEYDYVMDDGATSSGALGTYPEYTYGIYYETRAVCGTIFDDADEHRIYFNNGGIPNVLVRVASPVQALALTNGSPVNYTRVVEKFINNGKSNGKTIRYYTSYGTNGIPAQHEYPYTPPEYANWNYGQLTKEVVYDKDGTLLKKTENNYAVTQDLYYNTPGRLNNFTSITLAPVQLLWENYACDGNSSTSVPFFRWEHFTGYRYFISRTFTPFSGRKDLVSTHTVEYSNNDSMLNEVTYTYDTAFNVNKTLAKNSRNEQIEEIIHYPYEYTSNTVANAMKAKNMYAPPIATERWKTIGASKYLIGGIINQYQQLTSGIRKASIDAFESTSPVISASVPAFSASSFSRSASLFKEAITVNQYSNKGFVAQQAKSNDAPQSIIWDNNSQMPIAQATNATIDKIAYTSFETDGKGNWSFTATPVADATSPTGAKCYNTASGNITISSLTNEEYIISYWGKTGSVLVNGNGPAKTGRTIGSWTYYEHVIIGTSVTISGNKYIDELRLYPVKAQMSTLTYALLFGLASQCDVNNRITYYEYDGFGRLKLIRDQDRNILKTYDYQFKKNYNQ